MSTNFFNNLMLFESIRAVINRNYKTEYPCF